MGDHLTAKELNISLRSLGRIQKQRKGENDTNSLCGSKQACKLMMFLQDVEMSCVYCIGPKSTQKLFTEFGWWCIYFLTLSLYTTTGDFRSKTRDVTEVQIFSFNLRDLTKALDCLFRMYSHFHAQWFCSQTADCLMVGRGLFPHYSLIKHIKDEELRLICIFPESEVHWKTKISTQIVIVSLFLCAFTNFSVRPKL